MIKKTITDNSVENLSIQWDGERFALGYKPKDVDFFHTKVIILNIAEAGQLIDFIKEQIKHG